MGDLARPGLSFAELLELKQRDEQCKFCELFLLAGCLFTSYSDAVKTRRAHKLASISQPASAQKADLMLSFRLS
jgi:hypothetical protein